MTTFTVSNNNNAGTGSLRQAILDANAAIGSDTIVFTGVNSPITLTSGELLITDSVVITGPGASNLSVSGNNTSRVFNIDDGDAENAIDVSISGLTVTGGNATQGAGIQSYENLTLDSVVVTGNAVTGSDGGGLWLYETTTIRNSVITNNQASRKGGGIYFYSSTASLSIENSTISNNKARYGGGAYLNLPDEEGGTVTIRNSVITGNQASRDGGGIYFYATGSSLLIENSTFSNNTAAGDGGGIYFNLTYGPVTIRNSTISGNRAGDQGGGIYLEDVNYDAEDNDQFIIENSTISSNSASTGGGGLFISPSIDGPIVIRNSTITGNQASGGNGGGIYFNDPYSGSILESNIVANNTAIGLGFDAFFSNVNINDFTSIANNLFKTAPVGLISAPDATNIIGVDPLLGPLANNGGPTQTHGLLLGSAALNKGSNSAALGTDQRGSGFPRVVDGIPDIGAFEGLLAATSTPTSPSLPDLTISKTTSSQVITGNQAITYTITVSNIGGNSASNITVSDSLPAGLTFFTATATGGFSTPSSTDTNGNLLFTGGSLAPGASATLTVVVTTPNNISATGYTNTATVDPLNLIVESNENNNSASARVGVIPEAAPPPIGEPLPPIINISPPAPIPRGFVDKEILPDYPPGTFITPELQNPLLGVNILGGNGNDTLRGGAGNDTIRGGQGDDTIYGYGGNNLLIGGRGNDFIYGGKGNDTLVGTNADSRGKGEQDILIGNGGANLFVLGDSQSVYYDDNINNNPGLNDYALITDFNASQDKIQLKAGLTYLIGSSLAGLPSGAAIFIDNDGIPGLSANDELIGIIKDVSPTESVAIFACFQFI